MSDVVNLNGAVINTGQPVDCVVEYLEELLERARSGDVIGVAVAAVHYDMLNSYRVAGCGAGYGTIGALELAKAFIIQDMARGE